VLCVGAAIRKGRAPWHLPTGDGNEYVACAATVLREPDNENSSTLAAPASELGSQLNRRSFHLVSIPICCAGQLQQIACGTRKIPANHQFLRTWYPTPLYASLYSAAPLAKQNVVSKPFSENGFTLTLTSTPPNAMPGFQAGSAPTTDIPLMVALTAFSAGRVLMRTTS
jgi:hypothetical protein